MKTAIIFGNRVQTPDNSTEAALLKFESEGSIFQNYGTKEYYLNVTFLIGGTEIKDKFFIARGINTSCPGNAKWFNQKLFELLEKEEMSEEKRGKLAIFLMNMYNAGEVKEKDLRIEINKVFDIKQ